jgi:transposase
VNRFVGIDVGLRTQHRAAVLDGVVTRGKPFAVEMSRDGMEELLRRAVDGAEGPVSFVLDPTGLAWLPLAAYVSAAGHRVYLSKPQKAHDLRQFYSKHVKTDVTDAEAEGRLPQLDPNGVRPLRVPTAEQTTFRRLVKRRERLVSDVGDRKRRIHALLVMANPGLMEAFGEEKFTHAKVAFLRRYVDPEPVVRLGERGLERFWRRHSKGREDPAVTAKVFAACRRNTELFRVLRSNDRLPFDYAAVQDEVGFELDEIERADAEIHRLEGVIREMYRRIDPERVLEQLRGVGETIAAAIEALVGDVTRFPSSRRFVSYCGLCPRKKQSGLSDKSMPITKAGQALLKKYLFLAADVARHWDPDLAAYYARRYARGDHHTKILICLARKLAARVYALLMRRERARSAQAKQQPAEPVRYVLRDNHGREVDAKQARALIVEKYTRAVAAPDRHRRDARRRGKLLNKKAPPTGDVSGRPMDATSPTGEASGTLHTSAEPDQARLAASCGQPTEQPVENNSQKTS